MGTETKGVMKWTLQLDGPFSSDIIECKREIREREAAIKYHKEMLECENDKLESLEAANVVAKQKTEVEVEHD